MSGDYALFAIIVDAGSLSAAGRRLNISPAMVSKRLARLEERLGARLVHRTTRRLALTEVGTRFHADIAEILALTDRAEERVSGAAREPSGVLRVTMPTSFGRLHVAPHLHGVVSRYPKIELQVNLSDGFVDLMEERIDLAVRIAATLPAGMTSTRLAPSRRVLCSTPGYLADHGAPRSIKDLRDHRLLAADGQMPWRLVNGGRQTLVEGRSHVRTNSSELIRELALSGTGIALRSLWDVSEALAAGRLVRVLPDWEGSDDVGIHMLRQTASQVPPAVLAFERFLAEDIAPRLLGLDATMG